MTDALPINADPAATAASGQMPVILCVDDEPNILSSLRRLFRTKGYQVKTAESGRAGLDILEKEHVDLVISDMRMPEMDGAKFLEQVRERWPETLRLLLTGHSDVTSIIEAINRGEIYRYITKPWDDNDIVLIIRQALERKALVAEKNRLEALTQKQNEELKLLNVSLEAKVDARTAELKTAHDSLLKANEELKTTFVTSIKVFSSLIEMRGGTLAGHSRRVADLARKIAIKMGVDGKLVQEIFVAGLLHEIGKVGFPDELLSTPVATMTPKHLDQFRKHPALAEQLLMPLQDLKGPASIVAAQLERFDGTGYPERMREQAIPLGARVLTLASDYDNLQIGAFAQRQLSTDEAKALIQHGAGSRYDPAVVTAFMEVINGPAKEERGKNAGVPVAAKDLLVGMVLARDLMTPNGLMMLSAGHQLDERLITKIQDFEKLSGVAQIAYIRQDAGS